MQLDLVALGRPKPDDLQESLAMPFRIQSAFALASTTLPFHSFSMLPVRNPKTWLAILLVSRALFLGQAAPATAGADFAPDRLTAIKTHMGEFVDHQELSGAVTLVARHGKVADLSVVGMADLAQKIPLATDSLFWIASMTKPITGVAIMMLVDEGRVNIEEPVEKYLPEFKNQWLLREQTPDRRALVKPARPITVKDLLTHTAGLGGDVPLPRPHVTLAELVAAYAHEPLQFEPGSKWSYSNPGINTLGRIVEVVSGKPYAEFLRVRIFAPLGMKNTTFWPDKAKQKRLAKSYKAEGGHLEEVSVYFVQGELSDQARPALPAGGLFSTANDMFQFYQLMLDRGVRQGRRLLSEKSVAEMTHTQTGDIKTGFVDGMSWGLGFQVVKTPQGVTRMLSPGTFGHGGAYATQSWADPQRDLVLILMIQRTGLPNGDASPMRETFQRDAINALAIP